MGKSKEISQDIRKRIVDLRKSGSSLGAISRCLKVPRSSVQTIIRKYKKDGNVQPSYRSGRKKVLCPRDERALVRSVHINPRAKAKDLVNMMAEAEVRLVGGSRCSGRVEVLHRETWYTMCDADFDQQDAEVVCRELGCGLPVEVLGGAAFGRGEGQVWSEELQCRGNESQIHSCPTSSSLKHNCSHDRDVGLVCAVSHHFVVLSKSWIWFRGVRLVGGSHCSGRVEVLHGETWYTVCDADFDQQDAEVVCRELGCGLPVEVLGAAAFGRGEVQVWSEELQCRGNESQIHSCPTSLSLKPNCSHDSDVGLVCADSVRLVDGGSRCAGRVEVLHRGQWGTVCGDNWDMGDAAVVCRELGCGEAVDALSDAHFGPGSGPIWMDDVGCSGSESTLKKCQSALWGKHACNHSKDAGVICSGVRLIGGSRCSGRVEVLQGKTWYTVCDADFDQQDAEVVCRELGCGLPVEVLVGGAFGRGEGQVWSEELQCRGNESQIHSCPTSPSLKHNCSHDNDTGLVCTEVRLVGGSHCSGRVEVLHGETWYTVCDADFDQQDAEVVCRELGCGLPVEVLGGAAFGRGEGQVWSEELQCRGNESQIHSCPTSSSQNCTHDSDVGLVCAGHRKSKLTDGFHRCSGRVEVLHGKTWYTVCDADFDQQDAEVVCRELGCGLPVEVLGGAAFGPGEGHTKARLVNSSDSCSGRVELQYLSEWGTVCDVSWDMRAASVLCGQLKCGSAVAVVGSDWFGEGSGQIWADVFDCQGNETHLSHCPISSWSRTACSHHQDAGVICSGSSLALHEGRVRLSGGMECKGEVEVYFRQDWRRVLLDSWSESVASVVCRQLGCGSVFSFSSSSPSSTEHSHMCVKGFNCSGSEAHLGNCSSAQAVNCSSREQLYIICSSAHSSIRLVGSGGDCAGRLEVFHSGSWGTVCDDLWDIKDAQVVCRQLQCGVALSAPVPAQFGPGTGPIWLNEVECEGDETSLWNCRFQLCGEDECGHKEDVGVVCSEYKEIRLTEGCEGNLEVFYNGTWGNVCANDMTEETCPSSPWGQNSCDNRDEVARITCSGEKNHPVLENPLKCSSSTNQRQCSNHLPLRLSGGDGSCSGRLEVYLNAVWGSVCDDLWDIRDAQVVCRQLGCGPALSADGSSVFGAGSGPVWLNRVKCRGNEIHLWDCPHSLKNHTDCSQRQHAGVTCTDISGSPSVTSEVPTITVSVSQTEKEVVSPPPVDPSIYPVPLLLLGVLFFLACVLLVVLFYQNRRLRRVLSKRRHRTPAEAIYEEIDQRLVRKGMTQKGNIISEEQQSGYEDVDEELLSGKAVNEEKPEYYNDVITSDLKGDVETGDTPENYDDVITAGQTPYILASVFRSCHFCFVSSPSLILTFISAFIENRVEIYDDAVSAGENPHATTVFTPEGYDDVITPTKDVEGAAGYDDVAVMPQTDG
ncbi:hypothetical protein NFI96_003104 [Prochilodus magdalenae]|nr:hypothetical protein NFI96_003104 [Prochilodus magdalenae]